MAGEEGVLKHLGRHVLVSPANAGPPGIVREQTGAAEVAELDVKARIKQNVLRLYITMQNVLAVEILDGSNGLVEEPNGQVLAEARRAVDVQEETAVGGLLHQNVEVAFLLKRGHVTNDEGVGEASVDVDFPL